MGDKTIEEKQKNIKEITPLYKKIEAIAQIKRVKGEAGEKPIRPGRTLPFNQLLKCLKLTLGDDEKIAKARGHLLVSIVTMGDSSVVFECTNTGKVVDTKLLGDNFLTLSFKKDFKCQLILDRKKREIVASKIKGLKAYIDSGKKVPFTEKK